MTVSEWNNIWIWWLGSMALSFAILEGYAWYRGGKAFTLSDTIRRWHVAWRPLSAFVCAFFVLLAVHWFGS